jgi:tetratricopeptide (TPR) repeat protein
MKKSLVAVAVVGCVAALIIIYYAVATPGEQVVIPAPSQTAKQSVASTEPVATGPSKEALLIESKGLVEFEASGNVAKTDPQIKALASEMMPIFKEMGDGTDAIKNSAAIVAFGKIIERHPEYSDAYVQRAMTSLLANKTDYDQILSDIDKVIKLDTSPEDAYSADEMYGWRAKVDMLKGDYKQALDDLENAIRSNYNNANAAFHGGGVKPDEDANATLLNKKDFDLLVAKYPEDYRAYVDRGLFYRTFTFLDEHNFTPTLENLKQAQQLNPKSALVEFLLGDTYQSGLFATKAAWSDISDITGATGGYKERGQETALQHYKKAVELDSTFAPAYAGAAEALLQLKRQAEAIPYYDKAIELDPNDSIAYNGRGWAKTSTNDLAGAISDFGKAIKLKETDSNSLSSRSSLESNYESRADAYAKELNYNSAVEDYGHAIGMSFSGLVLLVNLPEIRAMYPEFKSVSDQDLLEGLRQKYYPDLSPADFVNRINKNKQWDEFVLAGVYVKRGDAYLHMGKFEEAQKEYARATGLGCSYLVDGWKTSPTLKECLDKTDDPLGLNSQDAQQQQIQDCMNQASQQ